MNIPASNIDNELLDCLKTKYFSNSAKQIVLKKDEYLVKQNEENKRLFLVLEGSLTGSLVSESGVAYEAFRSAENMFVGVHSFFSGSHIVYANVIATEPCKVAYIEYDDLKAVDETCYESDFLPLIVHELSVRQRFSKDIMLEKEQALKKLYHTQKMSTLGQMAAGLAHELNNAIGVLNGNSEWIAKEVQGYLKAAEGEEVFVDFEKGFESGQSISSADLRDRRKYFEKKFKIPSFIAKRLARIGANDKEVKKLAKIEAIDEISNKKQQVWELGVALHDMKVASKHAVHVLKSIKQLSAADQERYKLNINDTLHEALTLLKNVVREVNVDLKPGNLPDILANNGELIQIWVNIIKNGCESMINSNTENPEINIHTKTKGKNIYIEIADNGPGISEELKEKIFQPNFTTKKGGLSFGLGLGLSIVQRLVDSYTGKISVESKPGKTKFIIQLPI